MANRPISYIDPDGNVKVRVTVPKPVWDVMVAVGRHYMALTSDRRPALEKPERLGAFGLALLIEKISQLFKGFDASWISDPVFQAAINEMRETNFGQLPALTAGKIDINKLHRSSKLKSGFVGVYASGGGFRAMGRDFAGRLAVIGTFQASEEAAYRRWLYYKTNNLAYGELEDEMERWRNDRGMGIPQEMPDEQLIASIKQHLRDTDRWDDVFGSRCCTVEPVFSAKLPMRDHAIGASLAQPIVQPPKSAAPQPAVAIGFEDGGLPPSLR